MMFHDITSNGSIFTPRSLGKRHSIQEIKLNDLNFIGTYILKLGTSGISFILFAKPNVLKALWKI